MMQRHAAANFAGNLGDGAQRIYASAFNYNAWNQVTQELYGTETPLYHKLQYNIRGQLWDVRVSTGADVNGSWNRGCLQFFYESTLTHGASGPGNNGNVLKSSHYIPLDEQANTWAIPHQLYKYDALNRLTSVADYFMSSSQPVAQQSAQSYSYDRWGNRTINAAQTWGTGINNKQFTVDANTNRLTVPAGQAGVMSYDGAGNLTNDTYTGVGIRTYDAENHMTTAADNTGQISRYTYDANGSRVRRQVAGSQEEWQVYGFEGELLAEYPVGGVASNPKKEYGYRNGQLLITASGAPRINVAAAANGGTATASQTHSAPYAPSGAINGDRKLYLNNAWVNSTATFPQWLQVDFNGSKTIDEIDVFSVQDQYAAPSEPTPTMTFTSYGVTAFQAQYWDGSAWVTVPNGSVTGNNKVWKQITFSAITTNKIRIWITGSSDGYSRLTEVEAWGPSGGGVSPTVQWLVPDHLGTPRIIIDQTGTLANVKRHDYLPFGEELLAPTGGRTAAMGYASGDGVRQQFTAKERDNETGLDYFLARYYSSTQGRFTSADEFSGGPDELYVRAADSKKQALPYADIAQPQSMNKYAYVFNNPCRYVDPDGHCAAPSGLKPGQVGICVASFISSKTVNAMGVPSPGGRGDGRGTQGDGGSSRVEVRVAVDVKTGTVTKTDEIVARSGIIFKDVGPKGTGGSEVSSPNKDKEGNMYFQIHQVGTTSSPASVFGSIENHLNMVVTPDGKVGVTPSSTVKDYPSTEIYKYTVDEKGKTTTTLILHKQDSNDIRDLGRKEKPVQADPK